MGLRRSGWPTASVPPARDDVPAIMKCKPGIWSRGMASCLLLLLACVSQTFAGSQIFAWGDIDQSNVPAGSTDVVAVAAGHFHNLSLQANATLAVWPFTSGNTSDPASRIPSGLTNVVRMAGGLAHDLALCADGTVVAWGDNYYGQTAVPADLGAVVAIAAGGYHSLALASDGSVRAWGDNSYGQCAVPGSATNVVAIAAGFYHSVALLANGTILCWGDDSFGQTDVPAGLTNAVAVSAGGDHCLALTATGRVAAWGDDSYGQTSVPTDLTNALAVAAGDYHSLALRGDRTVVAWGPHEEATAVPAGLSNILTIAAGGSHSLALVRGGGGSPLTLATTFRTLPAGSSLSFSSGLPQSAALSFQWSFDGSPLSGATNAELTLENVQTNQTGTYSVVASNAIGLVASTATLLTVLPAVILSPPQSQSNLAGATVSLSVTSVSTVPVTYQWRFNGTNLPGATDRTLTLQWITPDQQGAYSVALSNAYGTVESADAMVSVAGLVAWSGGSQNSFGINLGDVVSLSRCRSASYSDVLVGRSDGTVSGWRLSALKPPPGLSNIVAVANGYRHAIALNANGTVCAWGDNSYGQTNVPPDLTNAVAIACGDFHSLALRADGTVSAWGDDLAGAINVPLGLKHVVAVAAGTFASLAVTSDGQVVLWGGEDGSIASRYLLAVPPGLKDVVALAGGDQHALALRQDGTVVAWGDNSSGQTNVPSGLTNVAAIGADSYGSLVLTADGTVIGWGGDSVLPTNNLSRLSNIVGISAGSINLALLGSGPPHLSAPLVSRQIARGATTSFRAVAVGLPPLGYQWQFDGTNLPAATNSLLTLTNVQPQQAGFYWVTVSNVLGVITSERAALDVKPVLVNALISQPYSGPAYAGQSVSFSVLTQGQDLSFQWSFNGTNLPDATNSTLSFPAVTPAQSGTYSLSISNIYGVVTSQPANLTVLNIAEWPEGLSSPPGFISVPSDLTALAGSSAGWCLGVNADGTVVSLPTAGAPAPQIPADLTNAIAIAAGWGHGLALYADGTVSAWGDNQFGQTNVPAGLAGVISIAAAGGHNLALKSDGTVVGWGDDSFGQTTVPAGVTNIVAIAAGTNDSLALSRDGHALAWGADDSGRALTLPPDLTNLVAIASRDSMLLGIREDGTLAVWHADSTGTAYTPPGLSNLVAIAANPGLDLELAAGGTIASWATPTNTAAAAAHVISVAIAGTNALALLGSGPALLPVLIDNAVYDPSGFSVPVSTQSGRVYSLEYKDSLAEIQWTPLPLVAGNGSPITLRDATATGAARYYRVRRW